MFKKEESQVVKTYDELLRKQQKLLDDMVNTGRQKDYEVQKVEKKYDSIISNILRQIHAVELQLDLAKKYVNTTCVDKADIATMTMKKEIE